MDYANLPICFRLYLEVDHHINISRFFFPWDCQNYIALFLDMSKNEEDLGMELVAHL